MKGSNFLIALMLMLGVGPAQAHFQLLYTVESQIERPGDVPVKLIFWHPYANGQVMAMGEPEQFYLRHRGEDIDLRDRLRVIDFEGAQNTARAYAATIPVKRAGDYVLAIVPAPYYEESEDIYIQQLTKAYLNRAELPTDWDQPLGMRAEILPLVKPYNLIAGSSFTGRVMADGKPVAGAEIEVEYIAALPDMERNVAQPSATTPPPGGAIVVLSDEDGYFSFGIARAGYWGFAALGVGPDTEYQGKELSQDAVIWVRAYDM